jgi:hypothetical protein
MTIGLSIITDIINYLPPLCDLFRAIGSRVRWTIDRLIFSKAGLESTP